MPIQPIELALVPFIALFGLVTSHEDMRTGLIRNKWIVAALIYSMLSLMLVSAFYYFSGAGINTNYFFIFVLNVTFALITGVIVWQLRLWNAADAKLFLAYAAIVPLTIYRTNYFFYFPAFSILLNTLVISALLLGLGLLRHGTAREKVQEVKKFLSLRNVVNSGLFIFGFSWLVQAIFKAFNLPHNLLISLAMLLLIYPALRLISQERLLIISLILSILHINFEYAAALTYGFALSFLLVLALFTAIRLILHLSMAFYSAPIEIAKLVPGMRAAEQVSRDETTGAYHTQPAKQPFKAFFGQNSHDSGTAILTSPNLTEKAINKLKKLHKEGKLSFNAMRVQQTMPFAPMMFVGVLATIVARGDLVSFVAGLF